MTQPSWLCLAIVALLAPLVPGLITYLYHQNDPDKTLQYLDFQRDIPVVIGLVAPAHFLILVTLFKTSLWDNVPFKLPFAGLIMGFYHALLGRYYFDLPGNLWLEDNPNHIFPIAMIIWVIFYTVFVPWFLQLCR